MIKYFLIGPNKYGSPIETKEDKQTRNKIGNDPSI